MKRNFVQVAKFLEQRFPELRGKIHGSNFPAPPLVELLQRIIQYAQMIGMAWMILGGETLFKFAGYGRDGGRPLPRLYWTIQNNGAQVAFVLYLLAPQILNSFYVNGAFEIYLDDREIFSKLKSGGLPKMEELVVSMQEAGLKMAS